ncbi:hypothetical protein [Psychromonas sp. KJ10-2]|uniref:hypothetical protein n=1 Tax=Psychromonas sp. KJ10-2 TaxID=3391822 RepID=UPI0039B65D82
MLILSGGHYGSFLDPNFIAQAFPSIAEAKEVRFDTRIHANFTRANRLNLKEEAKAKNKVDKKIESLLKLSYEKLPSWVEASHDDGLDEFSIINGLQEWYSEVGKGSRFDFGMLFQVELQCKLLLNFLFGDFSV